MFLHLVPSKRGGRRTLYGYLVESFRRPEDGRPEHRTLKALGALSEAQVETWRTALAALESGQRVVLAPVPTVGARPVAPEANLRYLDVAVLLELFREWELNSLVDTLLAAEGQDVPPAAVVAALAIQRCVEPGSKLFGSRWIPRTALPELLGVAPAAFNNTRLHRVLDGLAEVGDALQTVLGRRLQEREGTFLSLFLDTSEAVFEGRGPDLAEKSMTKDGVIQRRISIPLLCNHRGYPLRWDVLPGKSSDCNVFVEACQALSRVSWAQGVPLVLDRAAGTTEVIVQLLETGLHFVTALVSSEKVAYAPGLPCDALNGLLMDDRDRAAKEAAERIERAGFVQCKSDLFISDLGIVQRTGAPARKRRSAPKTPAEAEPVCRRALQLARQIREAVEQGTARSRAAAAAAVDLALGLSKKYSALLRLAPAIQDAVLQGEADALAFDALARIARLPLDQQPAAFESARRRYATATSSAATSEPDRDVRVRVVAYFNPTLFIDKRTAAQARLERVRANIAALNKKIARTPGKWSRDKTAAAADRILRRDELLGVFALAIHTPTGDDGNCLRVDLRLDEAEWAERRRYDGFTVLAAHPEITPDAKSLCALYRQRELVEHDFRVIKSLVELHPVRHRLDHKVKAHVTLCMLALLLERTLRHKLGSDATSEHALETLATCHLNHFGAQGYALTRPTPEQQSLLNALGLTPLLDDLKVSERITPR